MAQFRITCTRLESFAEPGRKPHIVAVGTGRSTGRFDTLWAVDEVLHAMDHGHIFYTQGEKSRRIVRVEQVVCPDCQRTFIDCRSESSRDADLENLPHCEDHTAWSQSREVSFAPGSPSQSFAPEPLETR